MLRYYTWAVAEQTLSHLPGGKALYRRVGRAVKGNWLGSGDQVKTALPVARKVRDLAPNGGSILDVGTGWFHHDAFLLHLVGDYEIHLFDIEDRAQLNYIRNYLGFLLAYVEHLSNELGLDPVASRAKLEPLLELTTREEIYARCNFVPCITEDFSEPFLPERSIDFMVSNCVLVHVRPQDLIQELVTLRRMLKDDGHMCHMLGHDDHWAFHDPSMTWPSFNYLRYSERTYRWLFDTKLEYHNRIVRPEWIGIFGEAGLKIEEYDAVVTDESRQSVRSLGHIDERYAAYPVDDLAVIYSYVLLGKEQAGP